MAQEREGRVDKADVVAIAEQTEMREADVYSVLWALTDLGYDAVKRA